MSARTGIGAINLTRPQYSSAKIAGVQVRGRKAQELQFLYLAGLLMLVIVKTALFLLVTLAWMIWAGAVLTARGGHLFSLWIRDRWTERAIRLELERIRRRAQSMTMGASPGLNGRDQLVIQLFDAIVLYGLSADRGLALRALLGKLSGFELQPSCGGSGSGLEGGVLRSVPESGSNCAQVDAAGSFDHEVSVYLAAVALKPRLDEQERIDLFVGLDEACLTGGGRCAGQELLLEQLAEWLELRLEPGGEAASEELLLDQSAPDSASLLRPISQFIRQVRVEKPQMSAAPSSKNHPGVPT